MKYISSKAIWWIIGSLLILGILFLIMVSFQRTNVTETDVKNQLETIETAKIHNDTSNLKSASLGTSRNSLNTNKIQKKAEKIFSEQTKQSAKLYFITLGTALLIGFTCFSIGSFCGFLFGIPRIVSNSSNTDIDQKSKNLIFHNDNLVQISDWLTKIIVGVGLTQISNIGEKLNLLGEYLTPSFSSQWELSYVKESTKAIAISTVLYFLILGFIACYLWTRFKFSEMLHETLKEEEKNKLNT